MAMRCVLLGQVLVLLWLSGAWAEVLVQPDFDAKKVTVTPALCRGQVGGQAHGFLPCALSESPRTPSLFTADQPCRVVTDPLHIWGD